MQDAAYLLRRIPLPRSWVNRASLATNPATPRRSKMALPSFW
jgi:hypothetical protein